MAEVTQPKRIADSASASLPQIVKSFAAMRLAIRLLINPSIVWETAFSAEPVATTLKAITLKPPVQRKPNLPTHSRKQ